MTTAAPIHPAQPTLDQITRTIAKRTFATLATTSPSGRPHVAGVLYAEVDGDLYLSTVRESRKGRNLAANPDVFVCIPVRRLPVGPPSSVQFASTAEVLAQDHPDVVRLAAEGRLKAITGHGELTLPGGCFVRIAAPATYLTYGLGLSLRRLMKDPLHASARVPARA
jgi:hypothetical protein